MTNFKNKNHDDFNKKVLVKVKKIDGKKVYFKSLETNEDNFCETYISELPLLNKKYYFFIKKTKFGWYLNAYEELKDYSLVLDNVKYRSHGELEIARFLKENSINFIYEKAFLIKDQYEHVRIWYPDFWLSEFGIIIEYFGIENNKSYEKLTEDKKENYRKEHLELIEIKPRHIKNNTYKIEILKKIREITNRKYTLINDINENFLNNLIRK